MGETAADWLQFGRIEIRSDRRCLLIDGKRAAIGGRAFDILVALATRRDRIVSKLELLDLVWPDLSIEENNLQVHVSALRKLLGAQVIATVPGRGYKFTLSTTSESGSPAPPSVADEKSGERLFANVPGPSAPPIGRAEDVELIRERLQKGRLLTICGTAGIGKTRVAQFVARQELERYRDGVVWVDLTLVADATAALAAVASSARLPLSPATDQVGALLASLRPLSLLLVLDNVEHLPAPTADLVTAILGGTDRVDVLVTSQIQLGLQDESVFRLGPLEVPSATIEQSDAMAYGACALFVERASAIHRNFAGRDSVATIVEICRRLDGLPLAIEIAAARVPALGVQGIADRLDERFKLLISRNRCAPDRHQTLRAALDWSHGLLSEDSQVVFRRLGVFAGSFSLELAQSVVCDERLDEWQVVDLISDLVDRSLVAVAEIGDLRYHLLETTRAYALERLDSAMEAEALRARHAASVELTFERAYEEYWSTTDATFRRRYEPELENLRSALIWTRAHDRGAAVALAGAGSGLLLMLSLLTEARSLSDGVLPALGPDVPERVGARFWLARASAYADRPDRTSRRCAERALEQYRELGDPRGMHLALVQLVAAYRESDAYGRAALDEARQIERVDWPVRQRLMRLAAESWVALRSERLEEARPLLIRQVALARQAGADDLVAFALIQLAGVMLATEDYAGAVSAATDLVKSCSRQRNARRQADALAVLLNALGAACRIDEARNVAKEFVSLDRRLGWSYLYRAADAFALMALQEERLESAGRLAGFADRSYAEQTNDARREWDIAATRQQVWRRLAGHFDSHELDVLVEEGCALDPEQACAIALEATTLVDRELEARRS